jgi:2-dehydro-3-deoxygluconokinase
VTRVVCIGECMIELRAVDANYLARDHAGDVYNTAVYLKRSFEDAEVQFLTATGSDTLSQAMRAAWRRQHIDDRLAFTVAGGSPGLYLLETDSHGERRFQYWRSNSAARRWLALLLEQGESALWGADLIYLSGISLAILTAEEQHGAIALMRRLHDRGSQIAFDPNVRLALWQSAAAASATITAALAVCDIALPSTQDLHLLFGLDEPNEQLELLRQWNIPEVALTLGPAGCTIVEGAARTQVAGPHVPSVVDTSGAGDAFNGTYLAERLLAHSPADAARRALRVASRVVTHAGALVPAEVSHPSEA